MGINELLSAETKRQKAKALDLELRAKEIIARSQEEEEKFRKWVPLLFEGEYPIKKWVVIEPPADYVALDGSWSLAAVLENDILLYRNSAYFELWCAKYEKGSADCWAKMPTNHWVCELEIDPQKNESNLAKIIRAIYEDRKAH
jgi:hypothetical protein